MSSASGKRPSTESPPAKAGASRSQCILCQESIDPSSSQTLHRVTGWEKRALRSSTRRGGSDITGRERTGELAHAFCVANQRRGVAPTQESLI